MKWILYEKWSRQFYIHKSVNISWLVTTTKTCSYYFNFSAILKQTLESLMHVYLKLCVCQCVGHISNTLPHNDVCLVLLSLLAHLSYCNIIAGCSIKIVKVKCIIVIVSISKPSFQWMKYLLLKPVYEFLEKIDCNMSNIYFLNIFTSVNNSLFKNSYVSDIR